MDIIFNDPSRNIKLQVFFSKNPNVDIDCESSYILISLDPNAKGWNDFAQQIRCTMHISDKLEKINYKTYLYLGFLNDDLEKQDAYSHLSTMTENEFKSADNFPDFFTILLDMASYRKLIFDLGAIGKKILTLINDLVAIKNHTKKPVSYSKFLLQDVFTLGFMRRSDTFYAFYNAGSIINGLEYEDFDKISKTLILNFKINRFTNSHKIVFSFDHESILPKRINILIGKNGVGKSQALRNIVDSLINNNRDILTDKNHDRPLINRLLALASPGETENTFPKETSTSKIHYQRLQLSRHSRRKRSPTISELIIRLTRSEDRIGIHDRFDIFKQVIEKQIPLNEIGLKIDRKSKYYGLQYSALKDYLSLEELISGSEQRILIRRGMVDQNADPVRLIDGKFHPLSSGQLVFIQFVIQAVLFIENGTLVLIDEPETHLHPNLISEFVELLDELLKITGSIAIMATHSAYFVREVPRKQVNVLKEIENQQIQILTPRLKTFGANVGAISHFVFEDNDHSQMLEKLINSLSKHTSQDIENILNDLKDEISIKAYLDIKDYFFKDKK